MNYEVLSDPNWFQLYAELIGNTPETIDPERKQIIDRLIEFFYFLNGNYYDRRNEILVKIADYVKRSLVIKYPQHAEAIERLVSALSKADVDLTNDDLLQLSANSKIKSGNTNIVKPKVDEILELTSQPDDKSLAEFAEWFMGDEAFKGY